MLSSEEYIQPKIRSLMKRVKVRFIKRFSYPKTFIFLLKSKIPNVISTLNKVTNKYMSPIPKILPKAQLIFKVLSR